MKSFFLALVLLFSTSAWASVNINTADLGELGTLPGIGPAKAAAIVQYRTDHGPFKTIDQLDEVSGIGPATMASLRDLIVVGGGGDAPAVATLSSAGTTPPPSSSAGCPVNINTADASALGNLPGIGPSKATAILQYRTDHGAFSSCADLDNVTGIGPATLAGFADCCAVK